MPFTGTLLAAILAATAPPDAAPVPGDVLVGLSAEFADQTSTVDDAVELGIRR